MSLSLDFWLELLTIVLVFGVIIYCMPYIRNYSLHKGQAINLRKRISERIKDSLPVIMALNGQMGLAVQFAPLTFSLQRLKALMTESSVLYSDERERVQRFIEAMEVVINALESGRSRPEEVEELVLQGQRILLDLKENGLLSHTA